VLYSSTLDPSQYVGVKGATKLDLQQRIAVLPRKSIARLLLAIREVGVVVDLEDFVTRKSLRMTD
jgi:hypothetical protein